MVPPTVDGMRFRDLLGQVNQTLAARASRVTLMVAGIPTVIKSEATPLPNPLVSRVSSILRRLDSIVAPIPGRASWPGAGWTSSPSPREVWDGSRISARDLAS